MKITSAIYTPSTSIGVASQLMVTTQSVVESNGQELRGAPLTSEVVLTTEQETAIETLIASFMAS